MRKTLTLAMLATSLLLARAQAASPAPVEVKVVVVTMFEIGKDEGDEAGEFQLWKARQKLTTRYPFAHFHDLFFNPKTGVLGVLTGEGTANSATAVMELGMDPRFDLTHAYWVVAGIAGVDPADASVGSAAWAEYVVDGDLAHEIDAREMPKDWTTGRFPLDSKKPYDPGAHPAPGQMFQLDPALVNWAYELTRNVPIPDSPSLQKARAIYTGYPNALKPPFVLKGDNLAAMTFWHGKLLNDWANEWVSYWTKGKGNFVTSAMEDSGTLVALNYLARTKKVDKDRALVLRTASNYTMQPPGLTAAQNMARENEGYSGMQASVESAYSVGAKVVDEIVAHWSTYRDHSPAEKH